MGAHGLGYDPKCHLLYFWKGKTWYLFRFQILISICAGSIFPLLWSMYADCADYSEYKNRERATGLIFSSSSMSQKFGCAIGSLSRMVTGLVGFEANQVQSVETISGIKNVP